MSSNKDQNQKKKSYKKGETRKQMKNNSLKEGDIKL